MAFIVNPFFFFYAEERDEGEKLSSVCFSSRKFFRQNENIQRFLAFVFGREMDFGIFVGFDHFDYSWVEKRRNKKRKTEKRFFLLKNFSSGNRRKFVVEYDRRQLLDRTFRQLE